MKPNPGPKPTACFSEANVESLRLGRLFCFFEVNCSEPLRLSNMGCSAPWGEFMTTTNFLRDGAPSLC